MSFIDSVLSGQVRLPMVPSVVQRALVIVRDPHSSVAQVSEQIEQDPVLSSRVLRLANSSFFGGRRSLASIDDAVSTVGLRSLQTLLIASGAMAAFADVPAVNLRQFWMVSVISAAAARQIALRLDADPEIAYCAGLLQGVGHLILCGCHPEKAVEALPGYRLIWGAELAAAEQRAFGIAHPAVSALWVGRLGLPADVVEAVCHSLEPMSVASPRLGRVLQLAASVATSVAAGETVEQAVARVDVALVAVLHLEAYLASEGFDSDFSELQDLDSASLA